MTKSAKTFGGAKKLTQILLLPLMFALAACTESSQQADPDFQPLDVAPSFVSADGPVVLIDEAHHNFLTLSGRYKPFAQVLETEGYSVRANTSRFSRESLQQADVLVIANALDRALSTLLRTLLASNSVTDMLPRRSFVPMTPRSLSIRLPSNSRKSKLSVAQHSKHRRKPSHC